MLCNECNERDATIHLCQIIGDKETKHDLCEICGSEFLDIAKIKKFQTYLPFDAREKIIEAIVARKPQYPKDAYLFVLVGMEKAFRKHFQKSHNKLPSHVSGVELLEVLRECALDTFGKEAKFKLKSWGISKCEDFGEIVFNLVEEELLAKRPDDSKEDFQNGYDFETAFPD